MDVYALAFYNDDSASWDIEEDEVYSTRRDARIRRIKILRYQEEVPCGWGDWDFFSCIRKDLDSWTKQWEYHMDSPLDYPGIRIIKIKIH